MLLEQHTAGMAPDDHVVHGADRRAHPRNGSARRFWMPATIAGGLGGVVEPEGGGASRYQGLRIHDLRHTAVSFWIASGANVKQLTTWAGHTSVATLLDRYGHLLPNRKEPVMGALDLLLASGRPPPTAAVVAIG